MASQSEAELGRRYVDKLVKVYNRDGAERWVLVHVEVQTTRDADFALRMYVYHYRIFDRYNKPVASLAVLADDEPGWRPTEYQGSVFGCEATLRFPTGKLLDLAAQEAALEASANPFAKVVLAHLKARETGDRPADRQAWKLRLVRGLYEQGFSAKDVRELFRIIDWFMELPPALTQLFEQELQQLQQENRMPYVTSIERLGIARGLRKGIQAMLRRCFGEEGLKLMPEIEAIHDEEKLEAILTALETASTPDEVRRLWSPPAS